MKSLLIALALATSFSALANCNDPISTYDMINCESAKLEQSDAQLNANYQAVRGKLNANGKNLLRDAQRSWITYRDNSCMFEAQVLGGGGTLSNVIYVGCVNAITKKRARELNQLHVALNNNQAPAAGNPQQLASADAELNANYQAVRNQLEQENKILLRDAQRIWISFRDQNCAFKALISDRSLAQSIELGCKASMTQSRSRELNDTDVWLKSM